jgi:uridine phosphorylase
MTKIYPDSELIINPDGSVYHLNLLPTDIANTIITVGDPDRLENVIQYFDEVTIRKQKREFFTATGRIGNKPITCISTGIGTDNIDIVLNELDALVNIDFDRRIDQHTHTSLNIIRIGTSGAIQKDIPVDSILVSEYGIGMDGLMLFYESKNSEEEYRYLNAFSNHLADYNIDYITPYISAADPTLVGILGKDHLKGITMTNTGFYAPQGRKLRYNLRDPKFNEHIANFHLEGRHITNYEMETAGIYGLGNVLGHKCCAVNAIVANRALGQFSKDPQVVIEKTIKLVLEKIAEDSFF